VGTKGPAPGGSPIGCKMIIKQGIGRTSLQFKKQGGFIANIRNEVGELKRGGILWLHLKKRKDATALKNRYTQVGKEEGGTQTNKLGISTGKRHLNSVSLGW